jgi:hypothetical protein
MDSRALETMPKRPVERLRLATLLIFVICSAAIAKPASAENSDFGVLVGEWIRPDGGYIVRVQAVKPDGSVDVGYFNPEEIHIAEANVSVWMRLVKLFIKLQGKGYPGSTYTLYYYKEKDALAGFYYQAAIGQTFEVVFLRKKVE